MHTSDLNGLPTDLIRKSLYVVVEDLLKTATFEIKMESGAKAGVNFNGVVHRISFNSLDDDTDVKSGKLFLKIAPENEVRRKQFKSRELYLREIYLYEEVLPYFRQFQESRHINVDESGFCEYPKCYKSIDIEPECLFIQDMLEEGFSMMKFGEESVTFEHARLVLQVLARFHGTSLAIKQHYAEKFEDIVSTISNDVFIGYHGTDGFRNIYNFSAKHVIDTITDEKDTHILRRLLMLYERDPYDIAIECVDGMAAEPYTVIGHGDCWANNILFQFDEKKNPIQACFIDWQLARYASPVCDIVYFIFNCTTKEMRDLYYDTLLILYHETLSYQLLRLGSDPEKVFPYDAFLDQFKKFGKFGLITASTIIPIITAVKAVNMDDMAGDIENGEAKGPDSYISEIAKIRLHEVAEDMVRLNYI